MCLLARFAPATGYAKSMVCAVGPVNLIILITNSRSLELINNSNLNKGIFVERYRDEECIESVRKCRSTHNRGWFSPPLRLNVDLNASFEFRLPISDHFSSCALTL